MEQLDDRTLLAVTFQFTIIDPLNKYKSIRTPLQAALNAAGAEWATHLTGNATLEYNVEFSDALKPNNPLQVADGAAKSAEVVRADALTGASVYQLGTALEIKDGKDRNGEKADGGILIYGPNTKFMFFDPDTNSRTAPIPDGYYDTYTVLLHELAHSLGFASTRDALGNLPGVGMYTYDEHVTVSSPGFYRFGDFDDNAFAVYNGSVSLQIGNPNNLGAGRFIFPGFVDQIGQLSGNFELVDDLSTDLMGGQIMPGERKNISKLDLAILKDAETPVQVTTDTNPQGLYVVDGTGASDKIDLSLSNGALLIRVNNSSQFFTLEESQQITSIIVNGLNGNDVITLTDQMPAIAINGGAGADTIYGGTKGDSILGGGGNDLIFGRGGGDVIRGGDGNDVIYGQGGSDRLIGEAGNDHLDGGVQTDRISGGGNSDTCIGGTEDDFLFGDNGNDVLSGAGGKDRMDGGAGADAFYGGAGNDSVDYSKSGGSVTASIDGSPDDGVENEADNIIDTENIIGSSFDDALIGSEGANSLIGGAGNDTIEGGGGNDTLEGNNGADILNGGGGNDSILGAAGDDRMVGGAGLDFLSGSDGDDLFVTDDDAADTADGGLGIDSLTGDTDDELTDIEDVDLGVSPPLPGNKPDWAVTGARKVVFA
jgi:Ca2+-binding RTX toxin-like protein